MSARRSAVTTTSERASALLRGLVADAAASGGKPELWFGTHTQTQQPLHIAFLAESREQVRAFYEAAIAAGGKDNGPPGIREIYHPNYYGAFVIGPDGHNIDAVCHAPEP
jgi:hypothetical protein